MKYYLHDDLRYDYRKISMICKFIIAILLAICIVLIIVISNSDRAMKKNLISSVSNNDFQMNSGGDQEFEVSPEKNAAEKSQNKISLMNRIGNEVKSIIYGEKSEMIKAYFSNAFKTLDAEDASFLISKENCLMNYLSFKYEDNDFSYVASDTELKNEEHSSNTEIYLYLTKYKYRESYKRDYNYKEKTHIIDDKFKDSSQKTLTVLSS